MPSGSVGICAIDCTISRPTGIAIASQPSESTPRAVSLPAIRNQPTAALMAAMGTAIQSIVRMSAFTTEAAATASGEGAISPWTISSASAIPIARRGAPSPAGCSNARPPAAEPPSPARAPAAAAAGPGKDCLISSAPTSAPAITSRPACSSAVAKPRPKALPIDWKVMSAAMP